MRKIHQPVCPQTTLIGSYFYTKIFGVPLRQFAKEAGIPYSTLMTLLSRDLGGASFDVVIQICQKLDIDPLYFKE